MSWPSVITIPMSIISMMLFFMISGSKWIGCLPASVSVFVFLFVFHWSRSPIGLGWMRSRSWIVFFLHYFDWYLFFAILKYCIPLIFCLRWLNLFFLILTFTNWFLAASTSRWRRYHRWTLLTPPLFRLHFLYPFLHFTHFKSLFYL